MVGYLSKNFEIVNGKDTIVVPSGTQIEIIRYNYLPKFYLDGLSIWEREPLENGTRVTFYYRGMFLIVEEKHVFIPKYIGYRYNM